MFQPKMNNMFDQPLWHNGPRPGAFYNFPGGDQQQFGGGASINNVAADKFGMQRSSQPITTGTSVIGIKYAGGVIIAADTLISYGSLARYRNVDRVFKINEHTIIGVSGDYADFQFIKKHIDQKVTEDYCYDDKINMKPKSLYNWLTRVMYNKRSRFDPLWIDIVVGGIQDGEPFLGHVDMRGRAYEDSAISTGYGKHLAVPLLRELTEKGANGELISQEAAFNVAKKSMEVLYYRDARSDPQYKQAVCTVLGAEVQGPFKVDENWKLATMIKGYN